MNKIRKGDEIIIIAGKDKGRRGNVEKVLPGGKLIITNANMITKHVKANPMAGVAGGRVEREAPIDSSNVMLINAETGKGERVGIKVLDDGKKVRFLKASGKTLES